MTTNNVSTEDVEKAMHRAIDALYRPYAEPTVTRAVLRRMLLYTDGWITVNGRIRDIKSKHLGAGICKISLASTAAQRDAMIQEAGK